MSNASAPRTSPTMMRSGPHGAQSSAQVALRHFALSLQARRPRFQAHHVALLQPELCRVLDRDDALVSGMNEESALSMVVLPEPVPPETRMFSRTCTQARKNSASSRVIDPMPIRSSIVETDQQGTSGRWASDNWGHERRDDHVDTRAVREARVDHRRRFVDAAAERATMRSTMRMMCPWSRNRTELRYSRPSFS